MHKKTSVPSLKGICPFRYRYFPGAKFHFNVQNLKIKFEVRNVDVWCWQKSRFEDYVTSPSYSLRRGCKFRVLSLRFEIHTEIFPIDFTYITAYVTNPLVWGVLVSVISTLLRLNVCVFCTSLSSSECRLFSYQFEV